MSPLFEQIIISKKRKSHICHQSEHSELLQTVAIHLLCQERSPRFLVVTDPVEYCLHHRFFVWNSYPIVLDQFTERFLVQIQKFLVVNYLSEPSLCPLITSSNHSRKVLSRVQLCCVG